MTIVMFLSKLSQGHAKQSILSTDNVATGCHNPENPGINLHFCGNSNPQVAVTWNEMGSAKQVNSKGQWTIIISVGYFLFCLNTSHFFPIPSSKYRDKALDYVTAVSFHFHSDSLFIIFL
jgi:hypothetical protein